MKVPDVSRSRVGRRFTIPILLIGMLVVLAVVAAAVVAVNRTGDLAYAQSSVPAAPTGLNVRSVARDSVALDWDDPGDGTIESYQVLRRSRDGSEYGDGLGAADFVVIVDDTGSAAATYTDTSVTARTRYVYRVKARNAQGLSESSGYANAETYEAPVSQQLEPCQDGYVPPTPTEVAVTAVPIVIESTTTDYFALYVSHDVDGETVEYPVQVARGEDGTTTLSENVAALPVERYRVEKYSIADPADVDGDCIDDITELDSLGSMNPVNAAAAIALSDGAAAVPDHEVLETITFGALKFVLLDLDTDRPSVYFINTHTHSGHRDFLSAVSIDWDQPGIITGWIVYYQNPIAPDGSRGVYTFSLSPAQRFSMVDLAFTVLAASVPLLENDFAYEVSEVRLPDYQDELALYEQSRIHPVFIDDILFEISFIALNEAKGYGFLRLMDLDERPNPRDVVIYEALPNNLPRVAGIITTVPQTPLSHVNLRAIQDGVPNAFIRGALDEPEIDVLIDRYVHYTVTDGGYTLREATREEVDKHYASSRPTQPQTPQRDLSVTEITPLSEIGFADWDAFGVKAANVAVLRKLDFPEGTVPDGFAIPFYFYDEFMKHNGFYTRIRTMLDDTDFQSSLDTQEEMLKDLRNDIEDAETPQWIIDAIIEMNESFAEGINRRYRSSTNNEDLPGFNGAGLYDSKSQKPSEDEDDLAKSLKEVYASLWNFRAFSERDFYRIDHLKAAMGVLVHPSYQAELVNGVAVTFDPRLRQHRDLLPQQSDRRGPGNQSGRALGAGGNPVETGRIHRCRHLQPGAAGATSHGRRPTGSVESAPGCHPSGIRETVRPRAR